MNILLTSWTTNNKKTQIKIIIVTNRREHRVKEVLPKKALLVSTNDRKNIINKF